MKSLVFLLASSKFDASSSSLRAESIQKASQKVTEDPEARTFLAGLDGEKHSLRFT